MPKSQRITIKPHNIAYLQSLASQMGLNDLREVLNYLLLDCKGLGYTFGNKNCSDNNLQPRQPIGYSLESTTFESTTQSEHIQNKIDPTIERLLAAGLELDF